MHRKGRLGLVSSLRAIDDAAAPLVRELLRQPLRDCTGRVVAERTRSAPISDGNKNQADLYSNSTYNIVSRSIMESCPLGRADQDVMELLVYIVFFRTDWLQTATDAVCTRFPNTQSLLESSSRAIEDLPGFTKTEACLMKAISRCRGLVRPREFSFQNIRSIADLRTYLGNSMKSEKTQFMRALILNRTNRVMLDTVISRSNLHHVGYYPIDVARLCIEFGASSAILLHNHPEGGVDPSDVDVQLTVLTQRFLELISIKLQDHVVVTQNDLVSMREQGYIL